MMKQSEILLAGKKTLKLSSMLILLIVFMIGCRTQPIYNIEKTHVFTENKEFTKHQVYLAIKKAGASLGWIILKTNDGKAIGKLYLRDHIAVVTINYSKEYYDITYKDSTNLKYNSDGKSIHSNYNSWIRNLRHKIDVQLSLL